MKRARREVKRARRPALPSEASEEGHCRNCQAPLRGHYCHACGQKAVSLHVGLHDFLHDAIHEFLHLDGKILGSFALLATRPGQLTREFLEGRRARHISPLRLYLTFSVVFFALSAAFPSQAFLSVARTEQPKGRGVSFSASRERVPLPLTPHERHESDELSREVMHKVPRVMFLLMPAFALLTLVLYRTAQPHYVPHLYHAVHLHAFVFLALSAALLLGMAGTWGRFAGMSAVLAIIPYHYVALRRVFGGSWRQSLARGTAIGLIYLLLLSLVMAGVAYWTIGGAAKTAGA